MGTTRVSARNRSLVAVVAAVAVAAVTGGGLLASRRGRPVRIPGTREIIAVGRLWDITLTVQLRSCAISTGKCELATPLSSEPLLLGS
jgi:hypothetical protein